jgi:hypothetical protein
MKVLRATETRRPDLLGPVHVSAGALLIMVSSSTSTFRIRASALFPIRINVELWMSVGRTLRTDGPTATVSLHGTI